MKDIARVTVFVICAATASAAYSATWSAKSIGVLQPDHPSADCFYFTLSGVTEADPVRPGIAWFAVSRTAHPGAKELFASLLAAKLTNSLVTITTDGSMQC